MPKVFAYFSLAMSLFFIGFGFIIALKPNVLGGDGKGMMPYVFAISIFGYGIFRLSRAIKWLKPTPPPTPDEEENQEEPKA